eukprot:TRINITY_DN6505_c0_g1_i10.p4 TRINITY_DN6505_c0_g1~~TRINITY_DN6505_c0_g1_i10.p4  ORF type:complete len:126 (-),score=3.56 TRINITY_DN6505_c0_g1_i10:311-688(-)
MRVTLGSALEFSVDIYVLKQDFVYFQFKRILFIVFKGFQLKVLFQPTEFIDLLWFKEFVIVGYLGINLQNILRLDAKIFQFKGILFFLFKVFSQKYYANPRSSLIYYGLRNLLMLGFQGLIQKYS